MDDNIEQDVPLPPDSPTEDVAAISSTPSTVDKPVSREATVVRLCAAVGFSCSCAFLLLPILIFLDSAADVLLWGGLWIIGLVLPLPGLALSIKASRRRHYLGDGLDVLTSIGVGLGWVGVAVAPLVLVLVVIALPSL